LPTALNYETQSLRKPRQVCQDFDRPRSKELDRFQNVGGSGSTALPQQTVVIPGSELWENAQWCSHRQLRTVPGAVAVPQEPFAVSI